MTTWFVPGRVEVLGKHTDYAGGRSLICATDLGVTATVTDVLRPAGGRFVSAVSDASPESVTLGDGYGEPPVGHWGNYVATVVSRLEASDPGRRATSRSRPTCRWRAACRARRHCCARWRWPSPTTTG